MLINISLFLGTFTKLHEAAISFVMSVRLAGCVTVRPNGTARLPLKEFLLNLIFEYF